jgi:hypothetical protein
MIRGQQQRWPGRQKTAEAQEQSSTLPIASCGRGWRQARTNTTFRQLSERCFAQSLRVWRGCWQVCSAAACGKQQQAVKAMKQYLWTISRPIF